MHTILKPFRTRTQRFVPGDTLRPDTDIAPHERAELVKAQILKPAEPAQTGRAQPKAKAKEAGK